MTAENGDRPRIDAAPAIDAGLRRRTHAIAGGFVEAELRAQREQREEAAIARAAGVAQPEPHPQNRDDRLRAADHGPAHQRRSRRLEVVEGVDPEHPSGVSIRRARVRDPLRRMVRTGYLEYRCFLAAERFRADLEAANGAVDSPFASGGSAPPWQRTNLRPRQIAAIRAAMRAWQDAIGLVAAGVVSWVVVSHGTVRDYEACRRMRNGEAGRMLRDALIRLADLYGVAACEPPNDWA